MYYARFHGKVFVHPSSTISEQMYIRDVLGIDAAILTATEDMWRALERSDKIEYLDVGGIREG